MYSLRMRVLVILINGSLIVHSGSDGKSSTSTPQTIPICKGLTHGRAGSAGMSSSTWQQASRAKINNGK